jgi:hypothetical protein
MKKLPKLEVSLVPAIKISFFGNRVYTTAKGAAKEYAQWSHYRYCIDKLGLNYVPYPERRKRLERRVLKVFKSYLP